MPESLIRHIEATGSRPSYATRSANYWVLLSLREDFVPKLDSLRPLMPAVMRNRFALNAFDTAHGLAVVCRAGGDFVSEQVAAEIVMAIAGKTGASEKEASSPLPGSEIEPAYLSVMCHELFERMRQLGKSEIGSGAGRKRAG